jgi:hypothetical protein
VCDNSLPQILAALAPDKVTATGLLDGLEALGTALGVVDNPLDVLRIIALSTPFLPYGAWARRMCLLCAVKAEAEATGTLHLSVSLTSTYTDCTPTVRGAGTPLHRVIVLKVGFEQEVIKAPGHVRVLPEKEAPHGALVAEGRALWFHALDLPFPPFHRFFEMFCPT